MEVEVKESSQKEKLYLPYLATMTAITIGYQNIDYTIHSRTVKLWEGDLSSLKVYREPLSSV